MPELEFLELAHSHWLPIAHGQQRLPDLSRIAMLHLSYKKQDPKLTSNHRALTHQSHDLKFTERIIKARSDPALKLIFPDDFFGFRKGWGAGLEVLVVRSDVDNARLDRDTLVALATDVGGAFDKALRAAIRRIYERMQMPEDWRRAKEQLWEGMKAELWIDGESIGYVEWSNGVLQGGVLSPQDYVILTVYVHARVDQQRWTKFKVKQRWLADDTIFWTNPDDAQTLLCFLVEEYHSLFMDLRADKTEASLVAPPGSSKGPRRLLVPVRTTDSVPMGKVWRTLCGFCTPGRIHKPKRTLSVR